MPYSVTKTTKLLIRTIKQCIAMGTLATDKGQRRIHIPRGNLLLEGVESLPPIYRWALGHKKVVKERVWTEETEDHGLDAEMMKQYLRSSGSVALCLEAFDQSLQTMQPGACLFLAKFGHGQPVLVELDIGSGTTGTIWLNGVYGLVEIHDGRDDDISRGHS